MKKGIKFIIIGMFLVLSGVLFTVYEVNPLVRGLIFLLGISPEIYGLFVFLRNRLAK